MASGLPFGSFSVAAVALAARREQQVVGALEQRAVAARSVGTGGV